MEDRRKLFLRKIRDAVLAVLAVGFVYFLFYRVTGVGCPIKFMTGVSCPGCGMTRATLAAVTLHFHRAFFFHPLWMLPPIWVILYIFQKKIPRRLYNGLAVATVILFGIVYILRMANANDMIVVFQPKNGWIYRLAAWIIQ